MIVEFLAISQMVEYFAMNVGGMKMSPFEKRIRKQAKLLEELYEEADVRWQMRKKACSNIGKKVGGIYRSRRFGEII